MAIFSGMNRTLLVNYLVRIRRYARCLGVNVLGCLGDLLLRRLRGRLVHLNVRLAVDR